MIARHHQMAVRNAIAESVQDGIVDPNNVRARIPEWVPSRAIGVIYRQLRQDGTLVEHDHVRSNDVRGKNAGRLVPRYTIGKPLMVGDVAEPTPQPVIVARTSDLGPCAICRSECVRYGEQGAPLCVWCTS